MTGPAAVDGRSGIPSPWQHRDPWPAGSGRHDPETCEVCAPAFSEAAARGTAKARAAEPR